MLLVAILILLEKHMHVIITTLIFFMVHLMILDTKHFGLLEEEMKMVIMQEFSLEDPALVLDHTT